MMFVYSKMKAACSHGKNVLSKDFNSAFNYGGLLFLILSWTYNALTSKMFPSKPSPTMAVTTLRFELTKI